MTSRITRTLRLAVCTAVLTGTAFVLMAVLAPHPASAHSGPHDPSTGQFSVTGGQDTNCQQKVPGATNCPKFQVSNCHGATGVRDGWYARQDPLGGDPVTKMLVIFAGGGGQHYWQDQADDGNAADQRVDQFITDLRNQGFAIFQVRWGVDWPQADAGHNDGLHVACKQARILEFLHNDKWVDEFDSPSNAVGTCGFCIMGTSGGSSAVAWMLTHFMADTQVDAAFPTGGPPHGNMSKGCVPTGAAEQPYDYGTGSSIQQIDFPFLGASTPCASNSSSFRSTWDLHSIGSALSGGDHSHPNTRIHLIDGSLDPLRFHGYDWMTQMWKEPGASTFTTFQIVPGGPHSIYDTDQGMAALKTAILKTSAPRACNNGFDDDWDGKTDTADAGCGSSTDISEKHPTTQCDNATDDDGDGFIDFRTEGGDGGCSSETDATEAGSSGPQLSINDVGGDEGNGGSGTFGFTVTLSASSATPVTVNYATGGGTATANTDYDTTSGTLTFNPGETTQPIPVSVNGDPLDEPNETFNVTLSTPSGATIDDGTGVGTITDDDATPVLSVDSPAGVNEGGNITFTVTRTGESASTITFTAATANNTATAGADYTAVNQPRSFPPGSDPTLTVTVPTSNDSLDEAASETLFLNLSAAVNAAISGGAGQGTGTILDDADAAPTISVGADSKTEGTSLTMPVTLSGASGQAVSATYALTDGTATGGADYTATGGVVSIPAGSTAGTITIPVTADSVDELDETLTATLSAPVNASLGTAAATGTILDNDTATISIGDAQLVEGNPPETPSIVFNVTLSVPSDRTVTAIWSTAAGTATADDDYDESSGPVEFAPLETLDQISVPLFPDEDVEPNETFTVTLTGLSNASAGDLEATGTITNDDTLPTIGIADPVAVAEGDPGDTVTVSFTVTLSKQVNEVVTAAVSTSSGTATEAVDFATADAGTVTFPPNDQEETVVVSVIEDLAFEPNENFTVTLSSPSANAQIGDGSATGVINDDDVQSFFTVGDATPSEGSPANFTIELNPAPPHDVLVTYATTNGPSSPAVSPGDYAGTSTGTTTIPANTTSVQVPIATVDDALDEANETFTLTVDSADPQVGAGGDRSGTGTIIDGDTEPSLSVSDDASEEGTNVSFVVTLSAVSGRTVTVNHTTATGTAVAGDFTGHTSPVLLTFTPGQTTKTVNVPTTEDPTQEPDETFTLNLSTPTNAGIADGQGVGTVEDDDDIPELSVGNVTVDEGDDGTTTQAEFLVTLSQPASSEVSFNFATSNGSATAPADYRVKNLSTSIPAGGSQRRVVVIVEGDDLEESNEVFNVTISGVVGAIVADGTATATITDDDDLPAGVTISVNNVSVTETDPGTTVAARFRITLSAASSQTITVRFATANGTATSASNDYNAKTGTVTLDPGQTSKTFTIVVEGDNLNEPNEAFFVNLSQPTNATIADNQGVGTIVDDE